MLLHKTHSSSFWMINDQRVSGSWYCRVRAQSVAGWYDQKMLLNINYDYTISRQLRCADRAYLSLSLPLVPSLSFSLSCSLSITSSVHLRSVCVDAIDISFVVEYSLRPMRFFSFDVSPAVVRICKMQSILLKLLAIAFDWRYLSDINSWWE